ncbi:MAG: hypothetical protein IJT79_01305 [Ruminococcus sp.]|nr:hypothetical protein [Ruminococcus sp.]
MKKRFNLKNLIGKKNLLLTVVALVLVMLMVVGVSYSWIEQISNVEMQYGGVESPMHISTDVLNKPAEAKINTTNYDTALPIDLSHYFYESGNMHLSSCYSDSKTFYFPKKGNTGSSNVPTYRLGTKSDANVNYISVSFKLKNTEDYDQVYWFDKSSTFFSTGNSDLNKLIRCSMTVDGATSIFSPTETYKTVSGVSDASPASNKCAAFKEYQYDPSLTDQSDSGNDNYSTTRGANGNVLFTLPANKTSTITMKVWLEYDSTNWSVSLSNINIKLLSSFTKTRRISVVDNSIYSTSSSAWLRSDSAKLYLAIVKEHLDSNDELDYYEVEEKYQFKNSSGSTTYSATDKNFYVDIPAYYNGWKAVLLRCHNNGYPQGSDNVTYGGKNVKYDNSGTATNVKAWNWWATQLPDTFDDRTFTEYTPEFGSWSADKVHHFYYVDSWNWQGNAHAYMWDNSTATADTKVVENASWPGESMYWANGLSVTSGSTTISGGVIGNTHRIYTVFYDLDYTNVIFNNGSNYQTGDLWIPDGVRNNDGNDYYFDLRSGQWYTDITKICYHDSNNNVTYTGSADDEHFYYSDSSSSVQYATKYLTAGSFYNLQIHSTTYSNYYKPNGNNWTYTYAISVGNNREVQFGTSYDQNNYLCIKESDSQGCYRTGIYTIKFDTSTNKVSIVYPGKVDAGTTNGSDSSSGGSSSGNSVTTSMSGAGVYLYGALDGTGTSNQLFKLTEASSGTYTGELTLTQSSNNYLYHLIIREASSNSSWTHYQADSNAYKVLNTNTNTEEYNLSSSYSNPLYLRVGATLTYRFTYTTSNHKISITIAST